MFGSNSLCNTNLTWQLFSLLVKILTTKISHFFPNTRSVSLTVGSILFIPVQSRFLVGQYPVENGGWVETEINGTPLIKCIEMRYHEAAKWFTLLADFLAWRNPFQLLCGEIPSPHTCVIRWNSPMKDARGNNEGFNKFSQNPFRSDNYWNVGDCLQGPLGFVKLFLSLRK